MGNLNPQSIRRDGHRLYMDITFTGWDDVCVDGGNGDDRPLNPGKLMFAFGNEDSPAGVGDPIVLQTCADSPTQNFDFSHDAQVRESASQLCANVLGGKPLPGSSLGMWDGCDDPANANERFHLSGRIVSAALGGIDGQCAAWTGDQLGDAVGAEVRPCSPAPAPVPQQDGTTWQPIDPQN